MQDYVITSYVGVGGVKFYMSRSDVHRILGSPLHTKKSRFSDELKDYWNENGLQLTFTNTGGELLEISLYPNLEGVEFGGLKLFQEPGVDVLKVLHSLDDAPFEIVGTTIFPKLGLAVGGFLHDDDSDKSVTAFAKGRWDDESKKSISQGELGR